MPSRSPPQLSICRSCQRSLRTPRHSTANLRDLPANLDHHDLLPLLLINRSKIAATHFRKEAHLPILPLHLPLRNSRRSTHIHHLPKPKTLNHTGAVHPTSTRQTLTSSTRAGRTLLQASSSYHSHEILQMKRTRNQKEGRVRADRKKQICGNCFVFTRRLALIELGQGHQLANN